jgi:hypothetical protein
MGHSLYMAFDWHSIQTAGLGALAVAAINWVKPILGKWIDYRNEMSKLRREEEYRQAAEQRALELKTSEKWERITQRRRDMKDSLLKCQLALERVTLACEFASALEQAVHFFRSHPFLLTIDSNRQFIDSHAQAALIQALRRADSAIGNCPLGNFAPQWEAAKADFSRLTLPPLDEIERLQDS